MKSMILKAGDIYYYYNNLDDNIGFVKLQIVQDYLGAYGISVTLKVLDVYTDKDGYVGSRDRIKVGSTISANELQGVGASGFQKYIFTSKDLIKKLF